MSDAPAGVRGDDAFLDDQQALDVGEEEKQLPRTLVERFLVPPFSVLDGKQGYWLDRKRVWLSLGIQSELGRDADLLSGGGAYGKATSVFDPVLCELACRWFCPLEGRVLDPFAGGSVRGIVSAALGLEYVGFDLREEQVEANRAQALTIFGPDGLAFPYEVKPPAWEHADALELGERYEGQADFLFTCPPYADLEVYSDDPRDLSRMTWNRFCLAFRSIVEQGVAKLQQHSFAAIVIGDVRNKDDGTYRNLPGEVIRAFEEAGAALYNNAVLATPITSAPQRATRIFGSKRKLVPTHQLLLVFVKGSPEKAAERCREGRDEPVAAEAA